MHIGQRQVGRAAHNLAALNVGPSPQRPMAPHHLHAHIGMVAQARNINPREVGKQLPVPVLPVAVAHPQERRTEQAHQRKPVAPGLGGRGVNAQAVAPVAVAQYQVHLAQRQLRGAAQLVVPAQGAFADHHLALREQPVGGRIAVARALRHGQPGHKDTAIGRAANVQVGRGDVQLLKPPVQQRPGRQRHHHPGQAQGGAAFAVEQGHVHQFNRRDQPFRSGRYVANANRHTQCLRGTRLDLGAKLTDSRHNPAMKGTPGHGQQQPEGHQQPQRPPRKPGHDLEQTGRARGRFGHVSVESGRNYDPPPAPRFLAPAAFIRVLWTVTPSPAGCRPSWRPTRQGIAASARGDKPQPPWPQRGKCPGAPDGPALCIQ